ncbi:hypothetical protein [Arthrobacter sp. HLT1-21]
MPWILADGSEVANPIEQVARQLDAVRAVLRGAVQPGFFPSIDAIQVNLQQCVYAAQINPNTTRERLRFGRAHSSLDDLAKFLREDRKIPVPLIIADPATLINLADSLAVLFRCAVSRTVRRKLTVRPVNHAGDRAQRIVDIHLQLADLHGELARLIAEQLLSGQASPVLVADTPIPGEMTTSKKATVPNEPLKAPKITEIQVMMTHLDEHLKGVGDEPHAVLHGLGRAWNAALTDPKISPNGAVSHALFGSAATPRVKHIGSLRTLLGASVSVWCLEQARAAGLSARPDPKRSSHLLVSRT